MLRLLNLNILFQLVLTKFCKSVLFLCLPKVDHVIKSRKEPISAWIVEKSAVKTDIHLEKDHELVCVGKYPICIRCLPLLTFVYPLQYKLIIKEAQ